MVDARVGESDQQTIARALLSPSVRAGHMLAETHKGHPAVDVNAFVAELQSHPNAVGAGSFARSEEMLNAQAHALNELFYEFVGWGRVNAKAGHLEAAEIYPSSACARKANAGHR